MEYLALSFIVKYVSLLSTSAAASATSHELLHRPELTPGRLPQDHVFAMALAQASTIHGDVFEVAITRPFIGREGLFGCQTAWDSSKMKFNIG